MNIRWVCKKCGLKWVYPVEKCIHCHNDVDKETGKEFRVIGETKVSINSPSHPIIPYSVLILEDENGNKMPKKSMKEYKIGDIYRQEKSDDPNSVSIVKIKYDYFDAVMQAIELVGGLKINRDSKILIKPNIMIDASPFMSMTTNPKVVRALIEYLVHIGADKKNITIAETAQFSTFEDAIKKAGFSELADELGVKIVDIAKYDFVQKQSGSFNLSVSKLVYENDLIINVPIMKTHLLLGISGALENMTRIVSEEAYKELQKDPQKALEAIANLHKLIPKYFTLGDASIGMQGNGPLRYGEPAFLNMLFASNDPVAVDKIFQEVGLLPKSHLIDICAKQGIGSCDLMDIVVVGDELDACRRELKPAIGSKLIKLK